MICDWSTPITLEAPACTANIDRIPKKQVLMFFFQFICCLKVLRITSSTSQIQDDFVPNHMAVFNDSVSVAVRSRFVLILYQQTIYILLLDV
jgi:hypothetical protein